MKVSHLFNGSLSHYPLITEGKQTRLLSLKIKQRITYFYDHVDFSSKCNNRLLWHCMKLQVSWTFSLTCTAKGLQVWVKTSRLGGVRHRDLVRHQLTSSAVSIFIVVRSQQSTIVRNTVEYQVSKLHTLSSRFREHRSQKFLFAR